MNNFTNLFFIIFSLFPSIAEAQFDARQIPSVLNAEFVKPELVFGKARVLVKGDVTLDNTKYVIKDNILSENGFKIVNVSGNQGSQDETWITYNPMNPQMMVGSSNNTRYNHAGVGYKMAAYYTTNGGSSWAVSTTPSNINKYISAPTNGGMTNFDPSMAFDTKGNIYYAYGFAQVTSTDVEGDNGVFVNTSNDGGKTWADPIPVALENQGTTNQAFHDRYTLTCDVNPNSPFKDRLYIAWQRFKQSPGVVFSYSTDKNESWANPVLLPGSSTMTQAPMPATGPNGEVYVVWRQYSASQKTDMIFQRSTDGGKSWLTNAKIIMNVGNLGIINTQSNRNVLADKQSIRVSSCPFIAVDNSNGPRKGWIYVLTAGKNETGKPHILLTSSKDAGNTWSDIKVIDDNTIGTDVFFPSISVDPITGMVSIFYYSSQNDPNNHGIDGYFAASFDGENFTVLRLTPSTWYINSMADISYQGTGNFYWGDYSGITSYNATAYPIFWMPNAPTGSYGSVTSYVAIVSALPLAPDSLKFINTFNEPSKVVLNWIDPLKNKLGGNLADFKILVYKGDVQIAEVNKGVQTYTDNSAVEGQVFVYQLRTKTTDGLLSDFISVTGIAGGSTEPNKPTDLYSKLTDKGIYLKWKNPSAHIDGTPFSDFSKIEIYADADLAKTITAPNIQSGQYSEIIVELPTHKFYHLSIVAIGTRNGKDTKSAPSDTIYNYSGAPLTSLNENFDNTNDLVPTIAFGKQKWGLTNKASKSQPNSLTDSPAGNYESQSYNFIVFAPIVISADAPTLSWDQIALIESGDYGIVGVSKDLKTWTDIASFDKNSSPDWTGDITTAKWNEAHRTLSKYIGDTLYIRFLLISNFIKNGDGWYIDNLRLDSDPNGVNEMNSIISGIRIDVTPNPVTDNANINFNLPASGALGVDLYDILGNKLITLYNGTTGAGELKLNLSATELTNGVYYLRANLNGAVKSCRLVVNK